MLRQSNGNNCVVTSEVQDVNKTSNGDSETIAL